MGLFNWFKRNEKVETGQQEQSAGVRAGIPKNQDFLFEVNGVQFAGSFVGQFHQVLSFATYNGVLNVDRSAIVTILRPASLHESQELSRTKTAVYNNYVVRFLQLTDLAA